MDVVHFREKDGQVEYVTMTTSNVVADTTYHWWPTDWTIPWFTVGTILERATRQIMDDMRYGKAIFETPEQFCRAVNGVITILEGENLDGNEKEAAPQD